MSNLFPPNQQTYLKAKSLFSNDELVAFPTETIYGLGANALSDTAAEKIFQLKGRPNDNPLIVHLGEKKQITDYAYIENEIQQTIIDHLMPGPITLLLPKKANISPIVCKVPLVGIRLPSNEIAQKMLTTVNLPIAAPSANRSGKASPTNVQMVYDNLGENIPMIIDGGESEAGIESTVIKVDQTSSPKILILRPGFITKEDLDHLFHHEIPVAYTTSNPELSPGMKYKHYSIAGKVQLMDTPNEIICPAGKKVGLLITREFVKTHWSTLIPFRNTTLIKIRGTHKNLATCAHALFDCYHYFDKEGVDLLYVEKLPEKGIGYSIMNRVKRSAEGSIASG